MFVTTIFAFDCCCSSKAAIKDDHTFNSVARAALCSSTLDVLACITFLAIGILGVYGLIPCLSQAASYTLIGVGGFIPFTWVAIGLISKGEALIQLKKVFDAVISGRQESGYL